MSTYIYLRDNDGQVWRVGATVDGNVQLTSVDSDPGAINSTGDVRPSRTRADIIERVNMRTRRIAEGVLDMDSILSDRLQEICSEQRWPWRKKWVTFPTTIGTATYDMGSTSILAGDIEEIIRVTRIDSATVRCDLTCLGDTDGQIDAQEDATQGEPAGYFLDPGTPQTIHLSPVPNAEKTYRVTYWAIPNLSEVTSDIKLLPPIYDRVLVQGMVMDVFELAPGEGVESPNYVKAARHYEALMNQMRAKAKFSTQQARNFLSSEAAVQST